MDKKIKFSVDKATQRVEGHVSNISSEPKLTQKAMIADLNFTDTVLGNATLNFSYNAHSDQQFNLVGRALNIPLNSVSLYQESDKQLLLKKANVNSMMNIQVRDGVIDGVLKATVS